MLGNLEKQWSDFKNAAPGRRFEKQHASHRGSSQTVLFTGLGVLLLAGGIVLLFIPGPGLLLIAFGAGLIARQSLWLAKALDRLELSARRLARKAMSWWRRASGAARFAAAAALGLGVLGAACLGWVLIVRP